MSESGEMRRAMIALSTAGARVFRNNVAQAVVGRAEFIRGAAKTVTVQPGDVIVRQARVLHAGLDKGSADLIGLTPVTVTPAMLGRVVPVFTSIEMKVGAGRQTPEQKDWEAFVLSHKGIAGAAWSAAEAVELVEAYRRGAK